MKNEPGFLNRIAVFGLIATLGAAFFASTLAWTFPAAAEEIISSVARGGRLYDKWYKVVGAETPKVAHPAYPAEGKYRGKKGADWRCKECHGWDYLGKDGAYGSGKHFTGTKGINGMSGAGTDVIIAIIKDKTHGYTDAMMDPQDFQDLANFISQGQVDMDNYIDRATKKPLGNAAKGEPIYNTICANCHGKDGTLPKDMKPFKDQMGNPWEVMHKILNGHPGEQMPSMRAIEQQFTASVMPSLRALDLSVSSNILAHMATLK